MITFWSSKKHENKKRFQRTLFKAGMYHSYFFTVQYKLEWLYVIVMLSSENVIHVLKVFLTNCLLNILLFSSMFYKKQNIFHSLRLTSNHILMKACCKKLRKCINYRLWWKMEASRQIRKKRKQDNWNKK